MKRGWRVVATVIFLVFLVAAVAIAGMRGGGAGPGTGRMGPGPGPGGMAGTGLLRGMLLTSAVAASGDAVYVLVGDQLLKYDRNLNLEKKVEVELDWARFRQMPPELRRPGAVPPPPTGEVQ